MSDSLFNTGPNVVYIIGFSKITGTLIEFYKAVIHWGGFLYPAL